MCWCSLISHGHLKGRPLLLLSLTFDVFHLFSHLSLAVASWWEDRDSTKVDCQCRKALLLVDFAAQFKLCRIVYQTRAFLHCLSAVWMCLSSYDATAREMDCWLSGVDGIWAQGNNSNCFVGKILACNRGPAYFLSSTSYFLSCHQRIWKHP